MPGKIFSLSFIHSSSCFSSSTGKGRGPIRAISPIKTLTSCGNSSSPVWLKNLPNLVYLGSLWILNAGPRTSFRFLYLDFNLSASSIMVLNLIISNFRPFLPILICLKNTGKPEVTTIINTTKIYTGNNVKIINNINIL